MNIDYEYWKKYREDLTKMLQEYKKIDDSSFSKEERGQAIQKMAQEIGVKATARYFNIDPKTVRYWVNKQL